MATRRRGAELNSKLHMDRQPTAARITDPSLPAGKRREIDNVMKKARANTNDYWDKKLIEVEEKDPNRWRHTGYKKMYIQGESSSGDSEREGAGGGGGVGVGVGVGAAGDRAFNRYKPGVTGPGAVGAPSTSMEGMRVRPRSPPPRGGPVGNMPPRYNSAAPNRYRSRSPPIHGVGGMERRMSPPSAMDGGIGSRARPRSPNDMAGRRPLGGRPRSPPEPASSSSSSAAMRRKPSSRSPLGGGGRRRTPPPDKRGGGHILPRSKRPPSPPPRHPIRSRSNSSVSSSSDDSCSLCSPSHRHRSRSHSVRRGRGPGGPRSPPSKSRAHYRGPLPPPNEPHGRMHGRPHSPPLPSGRGGGVDKYRDGKVRRMTRERSVGGTSSEGHAKATRAGRHSPPEDPRLKNRPPEPPEPATTSASAAAPAKKKKKEKELRTRIKIEGEKRKKHSSSDSDDSGGSDSDESSLPSFSATTRLTLSERFGKMAQWSIDRSNMENMRITKDSAGGALKVMIEEGMESPPRRYEYSPAPAGHFPEELATTAPSGMLSWDDVRVRYEYYKSRGYLRDLDLKDYIKWEEWWYKYQEWLKQERYYEYWDRQQLRRRRKKLPVTQRLN